MIEKDWKYVLFGGEILISILIFALAIANINPFINAPFGTNQLEYRWVNIQTHLYSDENVQHVQDVMYRAKNAGYNGVLLIDWQMGMLDYSPQSYINNFKTIKKTADDLGLELYPVVISVSVANPMLAHDPNLAEGLPVRDALFVVKDGRASLVPDPEVSLPGGDFENASNNTFAGWDYQDKPGTITFADTTEKHGGIQSLRMEATGQNQIYRWIDVSPYRQYYLTLWIKTRDVNNTNGVFHYIYGVNDNGDDDRRIECFKWNINSTQDWTKYETVFNSLNYSRVLVYLGSEDGLGGTVWMDDADLEEIGLTNVIRRDAYPLVVRDENGMVYTEGLDFKTVIDPLLGYAPYPGQYDTYHESPVIELTDDSRIVEGQRLRVSFYHVEKTANDVVTISMTDPKAEALFRQQIVMVHDIFEPSGYLLDYDEIIMGNWENRSIPQTEGQVIAGSVQRNKKMVHSIDPDAKIFVWSDMFDPYHLAISQLLLVNGTINGSIDGVSKDITVVNWNYGVKRNESLKYFAQHGNKQILAGYYDGDCPPIKQYLNESRSIADINGVMYSTWMDDYSHLEDFALEAWGGK